MPKALKLAFALTALWCLVALLGPLAAPYDANAVDLASSLSPPGPNHLLGTDKLGRDLLSRLLAAAPGSLYASLLAIALSSSAGIIIGLCAALSWKPVRYVLDGFINLMLSIPHYACVLFIAAILGSSLLNSMLALCLVWWIHYALLVRSLCLKLKDENFYALSRFNGAAGLKKVRAYLLPALYPKLSVTLCLDVSGMLIAMAGLSYLGLGVQPPDPSWGTLLYEGKNYLTSAPHLMIFPGLTIFLCAAAFNFLGSALRSYFDPRGLL